ncbi:MAG: PAS domain-containing protein, partial [Calditrichota bacterium]
MTNNPRHITPRLFQSLTETTSQVYHRFRTYLSAILEHVGSSIKSVTGYSIGEFYSDPNLFYRGIHSADLPTFRKIVTNPSDGSVPVLHRWVHKNGQESGAEHFIVSMGSELGEENQVEGFAHPITGKKESRQEHPENNMYSTTYLEQLDETVWICNQDFSEVYYVNPAYERMWGQDPRRLLEHPASLLESVHPLDVNWLSSALRTGLGHEFEQEYRIIRPDGMTLWIRSRAIPVEGAWTEPRILVLSMDLTNHKFITQRLEEQLQILNQIHDSVVSTDLDGYVTSWNRSAEASLGYTAAEAIGMHISFIYPGDQIEFLETEVITPLNEKGSHEVEVQLLDKDNRRFHAHLSLSRFYDEDGQPRGVVGYFLDISEKIASATKLKEHIRLHQAVADLGMSALDGSGLTALFAEATKMVATTLQVEFTKVLELQPDGHSLLLRAGVGWKKGAVGK